MHNSCIPAYIPCTFSMGTKVINFDGVSIHLHYSLGSKLNVVFNIKMHVQCVWPDGFEPNQKEMKIELNHNKMWRNHLKHTQKTTTILIEITGERQKRRGNREERDREPRKVSGNKDTGNVIIIMAWNGKCTEKRRKKAKNARRQWQRSDKMSMDVIYDYRLFMITYYYVYLK